jgi:hypothetical protein
MSVFTCGIGGERAEEKIVLRPSGERVAIVCPVHGIIAFSGFKPNGGTQGFRAADGTQTLVAGEYAKLGANRWAARPPRGAQFLIGGLPVTENADATLTVGGFIDGADWQGWLENGVWLEEER